MNINFELLLVKDFGEYWKVIGITYSNALRVQPDCECLRASLHTIEICKQALRDGKNITIAKITDYSEIIPTDLVITQFNELDAYKQIAINEVSARMHQMLISISIIDLMDYLNSYVALLNAGYFITDRNREDKYFEIIEESQIHEEPQQLSDNATFEEEQQYIQNKQQYEFAQFNLTTLEKYLNSYDKISKIKTIADFLTSTREKIQAAQNIEQIDSIMKIYRSNLVNYDMVKN